MSEYSVKSIYSILTGNFTKIHRDKYVWERMIRPKHRFFLWLMKMDRIQTTKRLYAMGIATTDQCLICGLQEENQEHLFFECSYSKAVLRRIITWMGIQHSNLNAQSLMHWISRCKEAKFKKQVYAAVLGALVYHIWRVRNEVYWSQKVSSVNNTVNRVQEDVIERCYSVLPKKVSLANRTWLRDLTSYVCV